jgi:hypothetical protein
MVSFISSPFTAGRPSRGLLALAAALGVAPRNQCSASKGHASKSAAALNAPPGTNVGRSHEADAPRMTELHSREGRARKDNAGRASQQSFAHLPAPLQPPNPSLQPTRYGWLRQPTRAAELKR